MSQQIRGIILEGQSCAGKTSVFHALKRQQLAQKDAERNVIYLSEHYSQVLNLVHGSLQRMSPEENMKILCSRVSMLEQLNGYANSMGVHSRQSRGLLFVFERFHLNHAAAYHDMDSAEYKELEERLANLNAHAFLLTVGNGSVAPRLSHRSPGRRLAPGEVDKYIQEQQIFIGLAERSKIPTSVINTDELKWDEYAEQIYTEIGP